MKASKKRKAVRVTVRGYDLSEIEGVEMICEGKIIKTDNVYELSYEESLFGDFAGCITNLRISDDCIKMQRNGPMRAEMIFVSGKQTLAEYETPHGALVMPLITTSLKNGLNENGGELDIRYTLKTENGDMDFVLNVSYETPC